MFGRLRRSGGDWIVFGQPEELNGGEGEDAEHEMAFDLEGAADPDETAAQLVLQSAVDPFDHGSEVVDDVVAIGHGDEAAAFERHDADDAACAR